MLKFHAFLRLLLFLAIVAALSWALNVSIARLLPHADDTAVFLVRGTFDFLIFLFATWLVGRLESRTVADYGLPWRRMFRSEFWIGVSSGFAAVSALVGALALAGVFHVHGVALPGALILKWAAAYLIVFILVGVREEFRSRGYILSNLSELLGFWPAAVATSLMFGIAHLGNRNETWTGAANAALFGLVMCFVLRRSGNLWLPIGVHTAFDWGETYFYGVADSGATAPGHLLNTTTSGVDWLSGGVVGPEGSVLCTLLLLSMWAVFAWRLRPTPQPQQSDQRPPLALSE